MKARFEGEAGRRHLIGALKQQRLVECDSEMAEELATKGELLEIPLGEAFITQGDMATDIFFIIQGEAGVYVNSRFVASRGPRDAVGDMALVDPMSRRSATVTALSNMLVLRLEELSFLDLLDKFPRGWRSIALVAMDRLRESLRNHKAPNPQPVLFLGCAAENNAIAEQIQLNLKHAHIVVKIWTNQVFGPSGVPIDDLISQVNSSDFAAFLVMPNDTVISRGAQFVGPRDNVVFELGLFMGRLGRERTYIIKQHGSDLKIPSDLEGMTPVTYLGDPSADPATILAPVCTELRQIIARLGTR